MTSRNSCMTASIDVSAVVLLTSETSARGNAVGRTPKLIRSCQERRNSDLKLGETMASTDIFFLCSGEEMRRRTEPLVLIRLPLALIRQMLSFLTRADVPLIRSAEITLRVEPVSGHALVLRIGRPFSSSTWTRSAGVGAEGEDEGWRRGRRGCVRRQTVLAVRSVDCCCCFVARVRGRCCCCWCCLLPRRRAGHRITPLNSFQCPCCWQL